MNDALGMGGDIGSMGYEDEGSRMFPIQIKQEFHDLLP
jgi:hypothetical protein